MHICVEETLNKGVYYLFIDSNFRFIEEGTLGYTVTAYSKNEIPLENITEKNDVNKLFHKTMIDYCKKNLNPILKKMGLISILMKPLIKMCPIEYWYLKILLIKILE